MFSPLQAFISNLQGAVVCQPRRNENKVSENDCIRYQSKIPYLWINSFFVTVTNPK